MYYSQIVFISVTSDGNIVQSGKSQENEELRWFQQFFASRQKIRNEKSNTITENLQTDKRRQNVRRQTFDSRLIFGSFVDDLISWRDDQSSSRSSWLLCTWAWKPSSSAWYFTVLMLPVGSFTVYSPDTPLPIYIGQGKLISLTAVSRRWELNSTKWDTSRKCVTKCHCYIISYWPNIQIFLFNF